MRAEMKNESRHEKENTEGQNAVYVIEAYSNGTESSMNYGAIVMY